MVEPLIHVSGVLSQIGLWRQLWSPTVRLTSSLVAVTVIAALAGCGGDKTSADYVDEYGGGASAYGRILGLSDCATLQDEFDTASANNGRADPGSVQHRQTLGFMTAAQDRMDALDCN